MRSLKEAAPHPQGSECPGQHSLSPTLTVMVPWCKRALEPQVDSTQVWGIRKILVVTGYTGHSVQGEVLPNETELQMLNWGKT